MCYHFSLYHGVLKRCFMVFLWYFTMYNSVVFMVFLFYFFQFWNIVIIIKRIKGLSLLQFVSIVAFWRYFNVIMSTYGLANNISWFLKLLTLKNKLNFSLFFSKACYFVWESNNNRRINYFFSSLHILVYITGYSGDTSWCSYNTSAFFFFADF